MLTVKFRRAIEPPWTGMPGIALGTVPRGRGTPDAYVLVANGETPVRRWDLYRARSDELYVYEDALLFGDLLGIGFGHTVFIVPISGGDPRALSLRSYFVGFHREGAAVYVASGEDVTRLNLRGEVVWVSPQLAVDGIEIESIGPDYVEGLAEQDPPGDWRRFRIRTGDGEPA